MTGVTILSALTGRQKKRGGKPTSRNGEAWSSPSPQRAAENRERKWRKLVGFETNCGAPTTPAVKG